MPLILSVNKLSQMTSKINLFKIYRVVLLFISSTTLAEAEHVNTIHKKIILKASKERVWSALTNENELSKWWNKGVRLEPFVGGEFYEPWGENQLATGKVGDMKVKDYIEFTWKEKYWKAEQTTVCRFTIKKEQSDTVLIVTHSGWETFKNLKKRQKLIQGFNKGWDSLLPKLKKHFELKTYMEKK